MLSGGQDSVTCLYYAKRVHADVRAVTFAYGQRHSIELESARKIAEIAKVPHEIHALTFPRRDSLQEGCTDDLNQTTVVNLPVSFVPGRNVFFLTAAAAVAYQQKIEILYTGTCQTDFSGYPDCRDNTMKALNVALNLAMDYNFEIVTPLMWMTKRDTVELAVELDGCLEALAWSHSCYEGTVPPCSYKGCVDYEDTLDKGCPACKLRNKGFLEAGMIDPLWKRTHNVKKLRS